MALRRVLALGPPLFDPFTSRLSGVSRSSLLRCLKQHLIGFAYLSRTEIRGRAEEEDEEEGRVSFRSSRISLQQALSGESVRRQIEDELTKRLVHLHSGRRKGGTKEGNGVSRGEKATRRRIEAKRREGEPEKRAPIERMITDEYHSLSKFDLGSHEHFPALCEAPCGQ